MMQDIEKTQLYKLLNSPRPKFVSDFNDFYKSLKRDIMAFQSKAPSKIDEFKSQISTHMNIQHYEELKYKISTLEFHLFYSSNDLHLIDKKIERSSIDGKYETPDEMVSELKERYEYIHLI